jgi:hypothetical protein
MRNKSDTAETYLCIHEFYTKHDNKESWTAKPVPIEAESLTEMRKSLLAVLTDIERHGIRDADTGEPI